MKTKILMREFVTHDVLRVIFEKPKSYKFICGQATDISFSSGKMKGNKHPFTFANLPEDLVLEFIMKVYHDGDHFTEEIEQVPIGTQLEIEKPFGTLIYQGPGVFIAGGAGITPFISILRDLKRKGKLKGNRLIFSNKEQRDIIIEKELKEMFKDSPTDLILTLTKQQIKGYENGRVDRNFLERHIKDFVGRKFYVCGPPLFMFEVRKTLKKLGADVESIIFEK